MPDRLETLLAQIRVQKTCDLKVGKHVTSAFLTIPPHRVGILHLAMKPRFLLGDPTGCGKTPQALVAYAYLKEKDPTLRMIVVTIRGSLFQWREQTYRFLKGITASVAGYNRKRTKESRESRRWQWALDPADVMITTYHTLARDLDVLLQGTDNFILVFDEIQTIRSADQTVLFPSAQRLSCKARYVWGLSATPFFTRVEDLFAVFEAIKPGLLGGSVIAFRKRYIVEQFIPKIRRSVITGYNHLDELKAILAPYILKRPAEEINQHLPAIVPKRIQIEMGPKQRALYDQITALLLPEARGESPLGHKSKDARSETAQSPANLTLDSLVEAFEGGGESLFRPERVLSKFTSLTYAQVAADAPALLGFPDVPSAKWSELHRYLRDECANGEKVIVYTQFEQVVTWLGAQLKHAGISHARITGKETARVIERNRVAFQTQPDPQVMLIDDAGGQALDLQAAGIVVFYDLPWGWGAFKQVLGRARRIGSKHPKVTAVALLITDSIDIYRLTRLKASERIVDAVLDLADSDKAVSPIADAAATVVADADARSAAAVEDAEEDIASIFSPSLTERSGRGGTSTEISFDELVASAVGGGGSKA